MDCEAHPQRLLCFIPAEVETALDSIRSSKLYPAHAVLFQPDQAANRIFIVCRGKVTLTMKSEQGDPLPSRVAMPGEILGLSACVAGGCYEGMAETTGDVEVDVVPRQRFLDVVGSEQLASLRALTLLCEQLNVAHEQVRWVASLASSKRTFAEQAA